MFYFICTLQILCVPMPTTSAPQRRASTMGSKHDGGATGSTATAAIRHMAAITSQQPAVHCSTTGHSTVVAAQQALAEQRHDGQMHFHFFLMRVPSKIVARLSMCCVIERIYLLMGHFSLLLSLVTDFSI